LKSLSDIRVERSCVHHGLVGTFLEGHRIRAATVRENCRCCTRSISGIYPGAEPAGLSSLSDRRWAGAVSGRLVGGCVDAAASELADERILVSGEFVRDVAGEVEESYQEIRPLRVRCAEARDITEQKCQKKEYRVNGIS